MRLWLGLAIAVPFLSSFFFFLVLELTGAIETPS